MCDVDKNELLRKLPQIDEVLRDQRLLAFLKDTGRNLIAESAREIIDEIRTAILKSEAALPAVTYEDMINRIIERLMEKSQRSLRRAINATGVVLHTNLGRAKLARSACSGIMESAGNYSTLEYFVKEGVRGTRNDHVEMLIKKITGAEASLIVNNNAAAIMLCLSSMAAGKEVLLSRGELIEIGGSFRIPDMIRQSGVTLVEIGTTNKTRLADYRRAVSAEKTGAIMKIHKSNYKILGFTEEVNLSELVGLGREVNLPVVYDLGSGLMVDLRAYGIEEPTVTECLKTGIDIILFSGDKLLGGPQAGIIAGKKKYIDVMKTHPLARILRVDKMTLAALEETFRLYLDTGRALTEIPVLSMITAPPAALKDRAEKLALKLSPLTDIYRVEVAETEEQIGGGTAPTVQLKGYAVTIDSDLISAEALQEELRMCQIPIITRVFQNRVTIHLRTVTDDDTELIVTALTASANRIRKNK